MTDDTPFDPAGEEAALMRLDDDGCAARPRPDEGPDGPPPPPR